MSAGVTRSLRPRPVVGLSRGLVFGLSSLLLAVACQPAPPPNLLILVSDAFRADALSCAGGEAHTPNLCRLAERGVLFERAYSNAPWTLASSVSMFTGRPPGWYRQAGDAADLPPGMRFYRIPDEELLLGEALRAHGYEALAEVENPIAKQANGLQGFAGPEMGGERRRKVLADAPPELGCRPRDGRFQAPSWLLELFARPREAPFAALHWIDDPHAPYSPPLELLRGEVPDDLPRPVDYYAGLGHRDRPDRGARKLRDVIDSLSAEELAFVRRLYLLEVESVDERVGCVLAALERAGLADSTIVVFTSDHGEAFGEHGEYLHGVSLFDELVRVPLIVAGPGLARGVRVEEPVSHLDLVPTLADLLGLDDLGPFLGGSLRGPLEDGAATRPRFHYLSSPDRLEQAGVVHGRYKLITAPDGRLELYDLVADPGETRNLADELPEVRERLKEVLDRFRVEDERLWLARNLDAAPALTDEQREETVRALRAMGYLD